MALTVREFALDRPLPLRPGNVTAPARTPWGGRRIAELVRPLGLVLEGPVGEAWEVSFGPELPSRLVGSDVTLAALCEARGTELLGREAASGGSALLVKLVDTAAPLSVQIHPADDDPQLAPGESGKPECWLVTHAEPGARLWLGLSEAATETSMRAALERGGDVGALLGCHEVREGDFFVVPPGTPHAIGAGITLVEPQLVRAGKRGVTYRYFDWGRRYDATGQPSATGTPRPLHVEQALAVTRWDAPRGAAALARTRLRAGPPDLDGPLRSTWLAGREGLPFPLDVARLSGTGRMALVPRDVACGLVVVAGTLVLEGSWGQTPLRAGESALLPAAMGRSSVVGTGAHACLASVG